MAAGGSADKENTPPPPTSGATAAAAVAVAAASRRHGYVVKSCGVKKRPSRARLPGRVPLRDITNLIQAISAVVEGPEEAQVPPAAAATELAEPDPVVRRPAALQDGGASPGPAAKVARYSLLKGFR